MLRYIFVSHSVVSTNGCLYRNSPFLRKGIRLLRRELSAAGASPDGREETQDHFAVLGVDRTFSPAADLKTRYKRLMVEFHPDRHASSPEEVRAQKSLMATNVTRAYDVIEDPLSRALHLLELRGAAIGEADSALVDSALLFEIMELREEVDSASSTEELRPLLDSCRKQQADICAELAGAFREERIDDARRATAKLRYWNRLEAAIVERI